MTEITDSEILDEAVELLHAAQKDSANHKLGFAMMMYLGQKLYADTFRLIGDLFREGKGCKQSLGSARYWYWKGEVANDERSSGRLVNLGEHDLDLIAFLEDAEKTGRIDYEQLSELLLWAPLISGQIVNYEGLPHGLMCTTQNKDEAVSLATNLSNALESGIGVYFQEKPQGDCFSHVLRYGDLTMLELMGDVNAYYPYDLEWSEEPLSGGFTSNKELAESIRPFSYDEKYQPLFPFRSRELIKERLIEHGIDEPRFGLFDTKFGMFMTFNFVDKATESENPAQVIQELGELAKWHLPRGYSMLFLADELATESL
jgi:hypothetical protein